MRPENLTDTEILEGIRHPADNNGNTDIHTVEGAIRVNNTYRWYYGLGYVWKPRILGEIGVRYGYSLYALARGAHEAGGRISEIYGIDNESYCAGCLAWAADKLRWLGTDLIRLGRGDSQLCNNLMDWGQVDICNVDGNHTQEGAMHDLKLAWGAVARGGLILVDDVDYEGQDQTINLRPVVQEFCREHGTQFLYLPTTRGLAVIVRK